MTGTTSTYVTFEQLADRLSIVSGRHATDPMVELDWGSFDRIEHAPGSWGRPDDPVMEAPQVAALAPDDRAQWERRRLADVLVTAVTFERALQQALLAYAGTLETGSAELRYLYYEVVEEARHSQMFDRLATLLGGPGEGIAERVTSAIRPTFQREAVDFPEVLFLIALAGEEPFDVLQRRTAASSTAHPLLRAVCNLHVREEARHVAYARRALMERLGDLPRKRRRRLSLLAPIVVHEIAWLMLAPTPGHLRDVDIRLSADRDGPLLAALVAVVEDATANLRSFCEGLGIWTVPPATGTWVPREVRVDDQPLV